jgi:hypothetical protein
MKNNKLNSIFTGLFIIFGFSLLFAQKPVLRKPISQDSITVLRKQFPKTNKTILNNARSIINSNPTLSYQLPINLKGESTKKMNFSKNRPTVVVLIHGVTSFPSTDDKVGKLKGARDYWGYNFMLSFFSDNNRAPHTFVDASTNGAISRNEWLTKFTNEADYKHHFLSIYGLPNPSQNKYPFSAMLTYRDGSQSIQRQVSQTASQIVSLYNQAFGSWPEDKRPQIVLLCHSFGGIIARAICSAAPNIPSNDANIQSESFTTTDLENMNFIRNRVLHITTMSTPHEGSPVTMNAQIGEFLQFIPQIDESDPDTPIIKQLKTGFITNLNRTVLHPNKCLRTDNSLIPIHAIGGRSPGGPLYFKNPNQHDNDLTTIDGGIGRVNVEQLLPNGSNRNQFEAFNLVQVDYIMHLLFGDIFNNRNVWGRVPANNRQLDKVNIQDVDFPISCLIKPKYNFTSLLAKPRLYYLQHQWIQNVNPLNFCDGTFRPITTIMASDGEIDSDGFVPINSALGTKLGTSTENFFSNRTSGSWYRFYDSAANFHNHGSIKLFSEIGKWLREEIIGNSVSTLNNGALNSQKSAGHRVSNTGSISVW